MYSLNDDGNISISRLESLVNSFIELFVTPELNQEIINRLDDLATEIINCLFQSGDSDDIDYYTEELMTYVTERISECGAEEYAIPKIDLLISIYDNEPN